MWLHDGDGFRAPTAPHWSEHYRTHQRRPEIVTPAPWIVRRYLATTPRRVRLDELPAHHQHLIIIYKENARERGATAYYLGRPILAGRALATVAGVGKRECEVDGGGMEGVGSILHPTPRRRFSSERSISL